MCAYENVPTERKWQQKWKEWKIYQFDFDSDKPVYCIDNPPRYTSGSLHLGHATGYSLIDFAARYHRMRGYNVMFPLCFDVNGTPIEVKVEKKYNITKLTIPRQEYIKLCSEFANSFIAEMTGQFEILGECMDPTIYYQTDAPYYRRITQITFLKMLEKGLAYKGTVPGQLVPPLHHRPGGRGGGVRGQRHQAELHQVPRRECGRDISHRHHPAGAASAPASSIAVHPKDERYKDLVGKRLLTPIFGKEVKVIADDKVDPAFGTGIVMICTIGDKTDLEWVHEVQRCRWSKGIDEQGRMTELAGKFAGNEGQGGARRRSSSS